MKKQDISGWIRLLLTPVMLIVLGLILAVNPDSASALIARIFGWLLLIAAGVLAVLAVVDRVGMVGKVLSACLCLAAGIWLLRNPLMLAAGIGRVAGVLLIVRGVQDILDGAGWHRGLLAAVLTIVIGAVLIAMPMTTSRVVLLLCGIALIAAGVGMLAFRVKLRRHLKEPDDPNIIDAL